MERLLWPFTFQRLSRDDCFSYVAEEIVDVSQLAAIIFSLKWHKGFPFLHATWVIPNALSTWGIPNVLF